jgi:hypothetical protein
MQVRAIPPRDGAGPAEAEAGDLSAVAPQIAAEPSAASDGRRAPAGESGSGAAAGGAAAGGAAAGGAPVARAQKRAAFIKDAADPKPRTAYWLFVEERTP